MAAIRSALRNPTRKRLAAYVDDEHASIVPEPNEPA